MNLFITIILLLIIIIIVIATDNDSFTTTAVDQTTNNRIVLQEEYTWPCTGCSTSTVLKPKIKYNLTDDRCLTTKLSDYSTPVSKLIDVYYYNTEPGVDFQSCDTVINTMYAPIKGQYIILEKSSPFTMSTLSIKDRSSNNIIISTLVTYTPVGTVDSIVNKDNMVWPITNYIFIDLRSPLPISYIKITHSSQNDANSFVGTNIIIAEGTTIVDTINEIFNKTITDSSLVKIIYTQKNINTSKPRSINRSYTWPNCTNCTSQSGLLYKGSNYTLADGRCFKLKDYLGTTQLTDSYLNTLNSNDMNLKYLSCNAMRETRIVQPKYIWNASIKSSILKPDNTPVVNSGDQVNKWTSDGQTGTTFIKDTGSAYFPLFYPLPNNKGGINCFNASLLMSLDSVSPLNSTFCMAYRWNTLLPATYNILLLSYSFGIDFRSSITLQYFNGTIRLSSYYDPFDYKIFIPTFSNIVNTTMVVVISYNSSTFEWKIITDNGPIYKINLGNRNAVLSTTGGSWIINRQKFTGDISILECRYYNSILSDAEMELVKADLLSIYP